MLSALRGRADADRDCASFQSWQNGSAFCIVVGFGGAGFTPPFVKAFRGGGKPGFS